MSDRYAIAIKKQKRAKLKLRNAVLDKFKTGGKLNLEERASVCLIISDRLFPNSQDTSIDVSVELMYLPDDIICRIACRILGL
jgi:hypothetical protein